MREIRKDTNNIGNVYGESNKFTIKKKKKSRTKHLSEQYHKPPADFTV